MGEHIHHSSSLKELGWVIEMLGRGYRMMGQERQASELKA